MKKIFSLTFFLSIFLLSSCEHNSEIDTDSKKNQQAVDYAILQKLGFNLTDIRENEDHYIVERDILIEKSELPNYLDDENFYTRAYYYYGETYKLPEDRLNIRIALDSKVDPKFQTIFKKAISEWNNVSQCKLYFSFEPSNIIGSYDILVKNGSETDNLSPTSLTSSKIPSPTEKRPGTNILINKKCTFYNTVSEAQWLNNIMHAIGHTIGFGHRVESNKTQQIPNSAGNETESFMYLGEYQTFFGWSGFIPQDLRAIRLLYGWIDESGGGGNDGGNNNNGKDKLKTDDKDLFVGKITRVYLNENATGGSYKWSRTDEFFIEESTPNTTSLKGYFKSAGNHYMQLDGWGHKNWLVLGNGSFKVHSAPTISFEGDFQQGKQIAFKLNYDGDLSQYNIEWNFPDKGATYSISNDKKTAYVKYDISGFTGFIIIMTDKTTSYEHMIPILFMLPKRDYPVEIPGFTFEGGEDIFSGYGISVAVRGKNNLNSVEEIVRIANSQIKKAGIDFLEAYNYDDKYGLIFQFAKNEGKIERNIIFKGDNNSTSNVVQYGLGDIFELTGLQWPFEIKARLFIFYLYGSKKGITYELYRNGEFIDSQTGTGERLLFAGDFEEGTYMVKTNTGAIMNGSVIVKYNEKLIKP